MWPQWGTIRVSTGPPARLAGGVQGWLLRRTFAVERVMLIAAGLALVYPKPVFDAIGIGLVLAMQKLVKGRPEAAVGGRK